MPLIGTKAAASSQGFGQFAESGAEAVYIEEVFSTYLYTGNSSTQTITNGIDLAGEGGLVWIKSRSAEAQDGRNQLFDTGRGIGYRLISDSTAAQTGPWGTSLVNNLSSTGFTVGNGASVNYTGENFVSWTFRKQPKFFDVVTYTGNGAVRTIPHSLGSVPGCIIVKSASGGSNWTVYHRGLTSATYVVNLQSTAAQSYFLGAFNGTAPTSTEFTLGIGGGHTNTNGVTYVAYLFAHDAGGFGLEGTDNVISCGSFTTSGGSAATVTLGYEPQWVLIKSSSADDGYGWLLLDTMRGFTVPGTAGDFYLRANSSAAESGSSEFGGPTATGFNITSLQSSTTYIYIAIRRGPMKVPESGTEVYTNTAYAGNSSTQTLTAFGFPPDLSILKSRNQGYEANVYDRLRGSTRQLVTPYTREELTQSAGVTSFDQNGITMGSLSSINTSAQMIGWSFRRAPGFFDEVCYTGTGVARTVAHNLAAVPELMIVKVRTGSAGESWTVWNKTIATSNAASTLWLNSTSSVNLYSNRFNSTAPTSSVFTVGNDGATNGSTWTYVAYLFATLAGVSKVGSYTGTGTTQTINCGFTAGARFVMIKRTDSTGDWYVWDSARGIVAGNDPYLLLNEAAAEVTSTDYVDTASTGFEISSTAPAAINASGGTFIFLAIA